MDFPMVQSSEVPTKCSSELSSGISEELSPRKIPRNESLLGIFRGMNSSGSLPRKFSMTIPRNISSELPRIGPSENPSKYPEEVLPRYIPRSFPTNWWSSEFPRKLFPRNSVGKFRGKMNFRGLILSCFLGIPSVYSEEIPRKPNFVFPQNIFGNSSGYSEDFIFRRNVRQNTAVFL
ncbi:hypothetical protein F2Q69_00005078 [Brassica cretica]|uniref:Uncharacterized protein n=1 Tax=Brassica cretica TaxID=69181 RepID=A0A8S9P525_BRACR|nr:hypothetical protein F2Q69_00005078 [Brassica cretica]